MNRAAFMIEFRMAALPEEMPDNPPVLSSLLLLKHQTIWQIKPDFY